MNPLHPCPTYFFFLSPNFSCPNISILSVLREILLRIRNMIHIISKGMSHFQCSFYASSRTGLHPVLLISRLQRFSDHQNYINFRLDIFTFILPHLNGESALFSLCLDTKFQPTAGGQGAKIRNTFLFLHLADRLFVRKKKQNSRLDLRCRRKTHLIARPNPPQEEPPTGALFATH